MLAEELGIRHFNARYIKGLIEELKDFDPKCSADALYERYREGDNPRYHPLTILPIVDVAKIVKTLTPPFGKPESYEVSSYFEGCSQKDKWGYMAESLARVVQWKTKTLGQALRICNLIATLNVTYYVTSRNIIKIYAPVDCYVPDLLKSDLPSAWLKGKERYRLRQVNKKLDQK